MRQHGLAYTGDEYHLRLGIYLANSRYVSEFNRKHHSFRVGLNKFSCLTPAEYQVLLGVRVPARPLAPTKTANSMAPDSFDWRDKGVVTAIKDQAMCGSCWAFAAVGAQESQYAIVTGTLQSLSESNLVDCVTTCWGCQGGWPTDAYQYVAEHQNGQFMLEDDYPYKPVQGACLFDASRSVQNIKSYLQVEKSSETDLKEKLAVYGPAAVCIDASHTSFQSYFEGVYDEPACISTKLVHAVIAIGYECENVDYWIVKNSWGTEWGEAGYIRMVRNKGNQCGVATAAVIPVDQ